jgi:transcriptional regulator with XRE-family HTH domain
VQDQPDRRPPTVGTGSVRGPTTGHRIRQRHPQQSAGGATAQQWRLVAELRGIREGLGMSLAELAAATHYSKSSWGRWLAGERPIPESAATAFAAACGRDPQLLLALGRETAPPPVPGGSSRADVPRQLPGARRMFAARQGELAALTQLVDQRDAGSGGSLLAVVEGTAGVGRTALAVRWAHQVADRFRDGQLFADLGGFSPDGRAVEPAEVLRGFLAALGVPPERFPAQPAEPAAMYRSLLADRQVLVVLDNAHDSRQVRALLPGGAGCVTVVTSRSRLLDLVPWPVRAARSAADLRVGAGRGG